MNRAYRIVRFILVSLLSITVGIPLLIYLVLCIPRVHEYIRQEASAQLTELLGADVSIARLEVRPFSRVELQGVNIALEGDTVLRAGELNAGVSVRNLLLGGRIVVTDVELMSPDIRLSRDSARAPLNVQPILDRLKGKDKKEPAKFDLAVHTVVIRSGRVSYDVLSASPREGFDFNHIALTGLRADITAPRISNDEISVSLKRLDFRESNGMELRNLAADVTYTPGRLSVNGLQIRLRETHILIGNFTLALDGSRHLADIALLPGTVIYPSDFAPLYPPLGGIDDDVTVTGNVSVFSDSLSIRSLAINSEGRRLSAGFTAEASRESASVPSFSVGVSAPGLADVLPLDRRQKQMLGALGAVSLSGKASWSKPATLSLTLDLNTAAGDMAIDADVRDGGISGAVDADNINLNALLPDRQLGSASFSSTFSLHRRSGHAALTLEHLDRRGHRYGNVDIDATYRDRLLQACISSADSLLNFSATLNADLTPGAYSGEIEAAIVNFNPEALGLWQKYPGYSVAGQINGEFVAEDLLRPDGQLRLTHLRFADADGNGLHEAPMTLTLAMAGEEQSVSFKSDLIDFSVQGQVNPASLAAVGRNLLAQAMPRTFSPSAIPPGEPNDFTLTGTIHKDAPLLDFIKFPTKFLYAINIAGHMRQSDLTASLSVYAPYIQQGDKLIENSRVDIGLGPRSTLLFTTEVPGKFGNMAIRLTSTLTRGMGHAEFTLNTPGRDPYSGRLDMAYRPAADGVDMIIEQSSFDLGEKDMTWTIPPAFISSHAGRTDIRGFSLRRPGQSVEITGIVSRNHDDLLTVKLDNINLDNVFGALRMSPVVQFGGVATGIVTGSGLLGSEPILQTDNLLATDFSYCRCPMGDARVSARWNHETRGIEIHGEVEGKVADGHSIIDGVIKPMTQELDFRFHAKHTPMGFLHTFMESWASKVGGYASGNAHLWGNFKLVELEGDLYAENFALTVGFTNVTYYATDSVHIRPGVIALDGITLRDASGRTAKLDGELTHRRFQDPVFRFRVSDIDRLLAYDRPTSLDNFWGGKIHTNGSVTIDGRPGLVEIGAALSTAPGSEFVIELSNSEHAAEYNFLTFRDVTPRERVDSARLEPGSDTLNRIMRERVRKQTSAQSRTAFNFDLQADITPDVKMIAVMDPVSDDRITGYGSGHMGIRYSSIDDEMRLMGTYTLDRGDYNFSMQDIIRKNFTIRPGSSITFNGDPYDARLNISAIYQRHANLSDLDESFLTDKEVQRTSVPVNAVLNVTGSIDAPAIGFDLEFPTLQNSDVPRKVKSIVNTNEMMQQQIIYLLALDRFYTPEYMSATKGNELMSVASGTISSQLSNILGQLSDKFSVAPSVRSEAGDFSDMEVDVALSSTLLNNRLLLNGNFGYRDNSLNTATTQFVGDLDVEYLLTRAGNWRLKAYNHFNDRNLYVKTALTTQGVGLVFKHDFDHLFHRKKTNNASQTDNGGAR